MADAKRGKTVEMLDALKVERAKYVELRSKESGSLLGNRLSDGAGLFLFITPNGSKSWRFEYRFPKGGKRHVLVYGGYPDLSLSEARKLHSRARLQLASGISPTAQKKQEAERAKQEQQRNREDKKNIFRNVAADWLADETEAKPKSKTWHGNIARWLSWANEDFGNKTLPEITAADILALIKSVAKRGTPASAEFCRQTVARVFNYGIQTLRAEKGYNPAEAVRGAIIVPEKRHRPKLAANQIPAFLSAVNAYDGKESIKLGLRIFLHCFPRKRELAGAAWTEIDFDSAAWTIPAARMKMKREHVIPLSPQVLAMFRRLKELAGDSIFVFPSNHKTKGDKPMSGDTFNYVLNHSLGYRGKFGPHGARATAASILAEAGHNPDVIDAQLAHREKNETRAAYIRTTYFDQRRELLTAWSNMLDAMEGGTKIIPINAKTAAA